MYSHPYLDSSVYIAAATNEQVPTDAGVTRGEMAKNILRDAERGRYRLVASTLVRVEVLKQDMQTLDQPFVEWIELSLPLADRARALGRTHGLRPADAPSERTRWQRGRAPPLGRQVARRNVRGIADLVPVLGRSA